MNPCLFHKVPIFARHRYKSTARNNSYRYILLDVANRITAGKRLVLEHLNLTILGFKSVVDAYHSHRIHSQFSAPPV